MNNQKQAYSFAWQYAQKGYNVRLSKESGVWNVKAWKA